MSVSLAGKRAVVTGSSSGIGRAIALALAEAGANVVVNYHRSTAAASDVAAEIEKLGVESVAMPANVAVEAEVNDLAARAWQRWDGIDIWVNNAGADVVTTPTRHLPRAEKLALILDVDVRGTAFCSWAAGQRMKEAGRGVILNIGWDQAWSGMAGETAELFTIGKAAIMGFTKSLARSLAPEVRVNCLAPGWVQTAWGQSASAPWQERVVRETPLARWGRPEDIAQVALFLCSEQAGFITGQILNVNGGVVM